jgi:3-phenylpropionate/cinnamic acid dioxygenase small subunit
MSESETRERLRSLVSRSGRLLDDGAFDDYVGLYADGGRYAMTAKTPELPKPMTWMTLSRDELQSLFDSLPSHEWNIGERLHLIAIDEIEIGEHATVWSTFCVIRIDGDGRQELYASGRYTDRWEATGSDWRLVDRETRVANRLWTAPSPIPL